MGVSISAVSGLPFKRADAKLAPRPRSGNRLVAGFGCQLEEVGLQQ
jgi:hypothetical protein